MFGRLAAQYLRGEAARRARDAVASAAQAQSDQPDEQEQGGFAPDAPCHVAVVFALPIESAGLRDQMAGVVRIQAARFVAYEGGIAGRRVLVAESGPGPQNAASTTAAVLAGHRPRRVVSAGLAGGLISELAAGSLVAANSVTNLSGDTLPADPPTDTSAPLHIGRLLTVDEIIYQAAQKQALGREHGAIAVDMESMGVAQACRDQGVLFSAVRALSDTSEDELPAELQHLLNQDSVAGKLGAAAGALFRRPSRIKDLWRLRERAIEGSDQLGAYLASWIKALPTQAAAADSQPEASDNSPPSDQPGD